MTGVSVNWVQHEPQHEPQLGPPKPPCPVGYGGHEVRLSIEESIVGLVAVGCQECTDALGDMVTEGMLEFDGMPVAVKLKVDTDWFGEKAAWLEVNPEVVA